MTDMANTQLGSFDSHESLRRQKLDGEDLLAVSVRQLVGSAPTVPAFPKTVLASLDPVPSSTTKRPKRIVAWLALLASLAGAGAVIPRFATDAPSADAMIIKPLPKGLTLISLVEHPSGKAYVGSSTFDWKSPQGDRVTLIATLDWPAKIAILKAVGETVTRPRPEKPIGPPHKTIKLPNGIEAFSLRIPEGNPRFDQLTWSQDGFDLSLFRVEPRENLVSLANIAEQLRPQDAKDWMAKPSAPAGYVEASKTLSTADVRRTTSSYEAAIVGPDNAFYNLDANLESTLRPDESMAQATNPPVKKETVSGKKVTISVDGLFWTEGDLNFRLTNASERVYQSGTVRKLAVLGKIEREIITAASKGPMGDWKTQMARPRKGYNLTQTVVYRGVRLNLFEYPGVRTADLVCLGPARFESCQPSNSRFGFRSFFLADGHWLAIGLATNLPDELLGAARKRNVGPQKPYLIATDGLFDVITIGLDEVAVAIVPAGQSFVELGFNHGYVERPFR